MKISVIITAYKEPRTIGKSIESIAAQVKRGDEIIVVAPDKETLNEAAKIKNASLKVIKDKGLGKSAALNLVVPKAKGELLVLTDGDVYIGPNSIKPLLAPFREEKIGAVSGNPLTLSTKKTKYGFWSYVLTKTADKRRRRAVQFGKSFFCSGYLFAIRKELFPKLKTELLSEDGYISNHVYEKGYKLGYSEKSTVFVRYPDNFKDWIKQKKRSAGGYNQIRKISGVEMRSFRKESFGALDLFEYASTFKEVFWLFQLFIARVYLWILIYRDINIKKKSREVIWERVESTK